MSIEVAGLPPEPFYKPAHRARKQILMDSN